MCIFDIRHNVLHVALEQAAKLVDRIGGNVFAMFDGIIIGLGKAHLKQSIGGYPLFFHSVEHRFIANHNTNPFMKIIIFSGCGIAYLR